MSTPTTEPLREEGPLERARRRRLERRRARVASSARPACLSCLLMGLLWVLGLWYGIPTWTLAIIAVLGLALTAAYAIGSRGRTVR